MIPKSMFNIIKDALKDISTVCLFPNSGVLQWEICCRNAYWAVLRRSKLFKNLYRSHSLKYSFEYQNFVTLELSTVSPIATW